MDKLDKKKLPLRIHAGYGASETGLVAMELMLQLYLLQFYVSVVGLSASLTGLALALAIAWDAISDPAMGFISDRTRSRFGRRRIYILVGGILLALCFPLLFHPPSLGSSLYKFLFLFGTYILVKTAMTLISVPHAALGSELARDPKERNKAYGFRLLFGNFGIIAGTVLPGIFLQSLGTETIQSSATSKSYASLTISALLIVGTLISFFSTAKHDGLQVHKTEKRQKLFATVWRATKTILSNPIFIPLLVAYFIASMGRTLNSAIALYYYMDYLRLDETEIVVKVLGLFAICICFSILLWVWLAGRFGKKWPGFAGIMALGVATSLSYPFFAPGSMTGPMLAAVVGGLLVGSVLLFDSLVADITDYDLLKSGEQREGLYFGYWRMSAKVSQALGIALAGFLLDAIGYNSALGQQSDLVGERLALLFGPGVGSFFIVAALLLALLPWSNQKHMRVQQLLTRRQSKKVI